MTAQQLRLQTMTTCSQRIIFVTPVKAPRLVKIVVKG